MVSPAPLQGSNTTDTGELSRTKLAGEPKFKESPRVHKAVAALAVLKEQHPGKWHRSGLRCHWAPQALDITAEVLDGNGSGFRAW